MSMKLLSASSNPVDPPQPDVSTALAPLTQSAITTRRGQISLVPADAFARSSSARRGEPNLIYGTPVEDSQSDETELSRVEYVPAWAWSRVESTAIAHYLFYAANPARWRGWLINLYA